MNKSENKVHKPWVSRTERRLMGTVRHKKHLEHLERAINEYPSPVYYRERDGKRILTRYYTSSRANSRAAWCRKCCNRAVRHYRGDISSGGGYRKIADFWWLLY